MEPPGRQAQQGLSGGPVTPSAPLWRKGSSRAPPPACLALSQPASVRPPSRPLHLPLKARQSPGSGSVGPTPPAPRAPGWPPVLWTLRLSPDGPRRGFFPPLLDLRLKTQPCSLRTWDPPRTQRVAVHHGPASGAGGLQVTESSESPGNTHRKGALSPRLGHPASRERALSLPAPCAALGPGPRPLAHVVLPHADRSFPRLPRVWTPRVSPAGGCALGLGQGCSTCGVWGVWGVLRPGKMCK